MLPRVALGREDPRQGCGTACSGSKKSAPEYGGEDDCRPDECNTHELGHALRH